MDKKTVFVKTSKGENEVKGKGGSLSGDLKRALFLIDETSTFDEISRRSAPSLRSVLPNIFSELISSGYIRDQEKPFAGQQITAPKAVSQVSNDELDFTSLFNTSAQSKSTASVGNNNAEMEANAKAKRESEAARARVEAELSQLKARAEVEAKTKIEAEARQRAEQEAKQARLQLEAVAKAKAEAETKAKIEIEAARIKAEQAARIKFELEVEKAKAEAEARALSDARIRQEVEAAKQKAEQEAAQIQADLLAEKIKAEAEARALAEMRARKEAEAARLRAEQEAANIKAELEAAKAKAEMQAKALAEEKAKQETARLQAEEEAARMKTELAAAKEKADIQAKALAEEKATQEAARIKAEQEAAKVKAEMEAAKAKAEEEARKAAETAKIKAEHEAAIIKAEMEAAKSKAEAEARARALAEERARQENAKIQAELEAMNAKMEAKTLAAVQAKQELEASNLKMLQEVERIKAEAENLTKGFNERASQHEVQFEKQIDDSELEAERVSLERKIAEQEAALKIQNEEAQKLADEQARAWAAAEQRANELARSEAARPVYTAPVRNETSPVTKVRKLRKPLPVWKIFLVLLVIALLVIWQLPNIITMNNYIAPIENNLAAQFKQPVHITALRAETLPWPKLQLEKVTIGSAQEIKVGKVLLTFDPLTLFSSVKTIRSVELQDVSADGALLEKESVWLQELGANSGYKIANLTVRRIKISSAEIELPLFDGEVELTGQGRVGKVTLRSADEKYVINLQSDQNRWLFTFNAKATAFPLFPNALFDDFTANGEIALSTANFTNIDAQAYGGFLHGNAKLTWQKGWQLQGRIGVKSVELVKLFPKYGVSGELQGECNYSFTGNKLAQLADDQQIEGSFLVNKAVINNMDMVETIRQGSHQTGRTHVDELTGNFQANNRGHHFQQVQISSGILNGHGSFEVGNNAQISGRLSVAMKTREAGTSQLILSGTLATPILNAGR